MARREELVSEPAEWYFFNGGPGAPRYGDDPTKHAVNHDTETFVREVLQNANDQGLSNGDPVEITFRIVSLTGDERADFLDALGWNEELAGRLRSVTAADRGRGHEELLRRLESPDSELRLVIVEDRNTTGLTGGWDDDSNYAALVRDELFSSKQDDRAGGSYGLGKSVLWTFSGASTVVFNSFLGDRDHGQDGSQRLIARTKLPSHQLGDDDATYQGAGWLCHLQETDDGVRPASLWDDEAADLASRLQVDRPKVSGTSVMVVDYRDPTRENQPDPEALADEFLEAAVKYFWPAIHRGDLEVSVELNGETHEARIRDVPAIRPFVECFESRFDEGRKLTNPGDITGLDVPIELPDRADGTETPDADVRLAARLSSPADDDTYVNHLALFRGAGMVVKYYDQSRLAYGNRNFHGVLACGEARHPSEVTPGDREVERFLRYAEPPEHDDWRSTENLREQYKQGFRMAIEEMFGTLRDGLRHLLSRFDGRGEELADKVRNRFPIHGGQARTRSIASPSTVFEIESTSGFMTERWEFSGRVAPVEDEFEGWTAEVSLTGVGEDGSQYEDVPIATLNSEHDDVTTRCEDGVGIVTAGPCAHDVEFEGTSEPVGGGGVRSGRVGETQLEIRAELRTGDE